MRTTLKTTAFAAALMMMGGLGTALAAESPARGTPAAAAPTAAAPTAAQAATAAPAAAAPAASAAPAVTQAAPARPATAHVRRHGGTHQQAQHHRGTPARQGGSAAPVTTN